jgi:hypothetical protein
VTAAVVHRVAQFWRHTAARIDDRDLARALAVLGPTLLPLFQSLPVNEQRHGLDVLATVDRLESHPDPLLQRAALLHDLGKGASRFSVLDRSQAVFLRALSPRLLRLYLRIRPGYARRYGVYQDHARSGAAHLETLGETELAAVIAEHHDPQPRLRVTGQLRRADGMN